ncbi:MAG: DUF2079 domain-containing protein, partial [Myxococcota bacterium]
MTPRLRRAVAALAVALWLVANTRLWLLWSDSRLPAWDFGIFTQMVWMLGHGESGRISLLHGIHWLGDHFQPVLWLLAPLGWTSPYALVLAETTIVAAGAFPLARIAWRATRSELATVAIVGAWLATPGLWWALQYPVHPSTWVAPLLLFAIDAFEEGRLARYAAFCALALACKEDVGLYLAAIGVWLAFRRPAVGIATVLVGIAATYVCIAHVIPAFRGQPWHMFEPVPPLRQPGAWADPRVLAHVLAERPENLRLLATTFGAFGLLPLLDPLVVATAPFLAERVFSANVMHVALTFHYGAPVSAVLAVAAARGAARVPPRVVAGLLAVGTVAAHAAVGAHGPSTATLLAAYGGPAQRARDEAIARIPPDAAVLAQDTLAPRVAQ